MLAINPKIKQKAEDIRKKIFGSEVRESLASGLEEMSEDVESIKSRQDAVEQYNNQVITEMTDKDVISAPEIIAARGGKTTLGQRLDETDAQLAHKIDKDGSGQVSYANLSQEVREMFTGGSVAVVGDDSVITSNITDNAVTPRKTTFFTHSGKNLFDKTDITVGYYSNIAKNGNLSVLASYGVSDFIRVLPNTVYTKSITQQMPFFDENKNFISGVDATKRFTTPSNCAYVRINFELKDKDIVQLELGPASTVYEEYSEKVDAKYLGEAGKLKYIPSKNLFDISKAKKDMSVSVNNGGGDAAAVGFWATDYIELEEGKTYTKTGNQQFAFYDSNKQFVTGKLSGITFTVPAGVKYGRFTVIDKDGYSVDTFQLEEGSVATEYAPYREILYGIEGASRGNGILTVGKQGADFSTIGDALNSTIKDVSIIVLQGTYHEHLDINATNRKVSIIGVDAENTIIRDDSGDYYKAPLNANGNIYVENITFLSTHDDGTPYTIPAYAVHLDRTGAGVATFRNCKMISHQNSGVGIGTHQDQTIILDNCEIIKLSDRDGGALYAHNAQASNVTNQSLVVKNCLIKTDFGYAVKVDDANTYNGGTNSPMDISFYFNVLGSDTRAKDQRVLYRDAPINGGVSGQIKLVSDSFGNNDIKLNA